MIPALLVGLVMLLAGLVAYAVATALILRVVVRLTPVGPHGARLLAKRRVAIRPSPNLVIMLTGQSA